MMDWQKIKEVVKYVVTAVISIGAFVAVLFGVFSFVDWRIDEQINDADYLRKIARKVRPSLVFDEEGSIVADMGAGSLVDVKVNKGPEDSFTILVSPVEFLAVEPVLEPLDGRYNIRGQRGQKFDWVFHLSGIHGLLIEDSALPRREKQRFRLEIIR